jgi:hypothetical protein
MAKIFEKKAGRARSIKILLARWIAKQEAAKKVALALLIKKPSHHVVTL